MSLTAASVEAYGAGHGLRVVCMGQDGRLERQWIGGVASGSFPLKGLSQRVYVLAEGGSWYVCCRAPSHIVLPNGERRHRMPLELQKLVPVLDGERRVLLYVESAGQQGEAFHNYLAFPGSYVTVGRAEDCDIVCVNRLVSHHHARLYCLGDSWKLEDLGSSNGSYVNGKAVSTAELRLGDFVYAMGLVIVVGQGYLSVNDGRQDVTVRSRCLTPLTSTSQLSRAVPTAHDPGAVYSRAPRHRQALAPQDIQIEGPPISLDSTKIPLVLRMGGAAASGGMSAMMGNFMPLVTSLLFPVLNQRYSDQQKKEYEARRHAKYTQYLRAKQGEIAAEAQRERNVMRSNYPALEEIALYPFGGDKLWERRNVDDDFLSMRLGLGRLPLEAKVNYPQRRFELDEDDLQERMYELAEAPVYLERAPLVVSLQEHWVCGVTGDERSVRALVKAFLLQATVLHSYDECKVVVLARPEQLEGSLAGVRYLPHLWDDAGSLRFLATRERDAYEVGSYLREQLGDDLVRPRPPADIVRDRPYYLVIALDKQLFDSVELFKELMRRGANCGVSLVAAFPNIPKDSMLQLDLDAQGRGKVSYLHDIERPDDAFTLDKLATREFVSSLRRVANTAIPQLSQARALPSSLSFLDMLGVGRLEQLAPLRRWQQSDPVSSLAVPIGVAADGSLALLDLHERAHGPHGLVAGMTGSGKSEFLITYILSAALHFHPDELAFVLIDYKGGGLAGAFVDEEKGIHLPHVVGTITNLDGPAIQRSLISLEAELRRRQRVFNHAKAQANEGTMDIYAYQRLYRRGVVSEPVPHLVIVSDEFAELKQQQPEFMDQLVSIARIGRSLGVHLILATQKPAGVVNEQIWSNSKFKACLKVQARQDSMDMLKRPEAAELKEVGRYYLQIGYNESFSMGQSAWSGAPYVERDEAQPRDDESVQFVDMVGRVSYEGRPQRANASSGMSQLVATVRALCDAAAQAGVRPRSLWEDPLPAQLGLDELEQGATEGSVRVTLGLIDDPAQQRRLPYELDLLDAHNLLVAGESGSGKTTLLQSMLVGLVRRYGPGRLNFYALDFSGGLLRPFAELPHCGAVLGEEDEGSFTAFFDLIHDIVDERKRLFRSLGVGSFEAACELMELPLVLVIIDGVSAFLATRAGERLALQLRDVIKASMSWGVRFVMTCGRPGDLPSLARQEMGLRLSLAQTDRYGHTDTLGVRVTYLPPVLPGRGLALVDGAPMELQVARLAPQAPESEQLQALRAELERLAQRWADGPVAHRLPTVPADEAYEDFAARFAPGRMPLGYELATAKPVALPLRQLSSLALYFGTPLGSEALRANLAHAARRDGLRLFVVGAKASLFDAGGPLADALGDDGELVGAGFDELCDFFLHRLPPLVTEQNERFKELRAELGEGQAFERLRAETQGFALLFEDFACFADTVGSVDDVKRSDGLTKLCVRLFELMRPLNAYLLGVFGPQAGSAYGSALYRAFREGGSCLLFGSKLDQQRLATLPRELRDFNARGVFNCCVMAYRDEFHPLLMPAKRPDEQDVDPDERSIFD